MITIKEMTFNEWVNLVLKSPTLFVEIARQEGFTTERILNLLTKISELVEGK